MLERSHSFDVRDKNYDEIQEIMENILKKELSLSIDSQRLGSSLVRINYFYSNIAKEQQKNNRITLLQEPEKRIYIQINGKLTESQIGQLWNKFEKKLNNSTYVRKIKVPILSKEYIIQEIKSLIELKGYIVKREEIQRFIENFMEEYERLPKKNEFHSIVKGYMIMVNNDLLGEKAETSFKNETSLETKKSVLDTFEDDISLTPYDTNNSTVVIEKQVARRKCPSCGNEGLIHEMDDKNVILMDYPKIYGKKYLCGQCSYEWRKK